MPTHTSRRTSSSRPVWALLIVVALLLSASSVAFAVMPAAQDGPPVTTDTIVSKDQLAAPPAPSAIDLIRAADAVGVVLPFQASPTGATIASELADYPPASTVKLIGQGWQPGETVDIFVNDDAGATFSFQSDPDPQADALGAFTYSFQLPAWPVATFSVVATGAPVENGGSGVATTSFTDSQPPNIQQLWQCDPPSVFDPATYTCEVSGSTGWVSGNNDGIYKEGQTVPYRTRFENLVAGTTYSVNIEWDTTQGSKHALDYLRSYNATMTAAQPCASLNGLPAGLCSGAPSTAAIPIDTFMAADPDWIANGGVQEPGAFTMFGAALSQLSSAAYTYPATYTGNSKTSIKVTFVANSTDAVLAWGGHIAAREDWGNGNSAVAISGSPYHMRIISWRDETGNKDLNVGQMDRSLSSEAVVYPGAITIVKVPDPANTGSFNFTASPTPLSNFTLPDNGSWSKSFGDIMAFQQYSVVESVPSGWQLTKIECSAATPNGGTQTTNLGTATTTIDLKEGELVTCTYYDKRNALNLTATKTAVPAYNRAYTWDIYKNVDKTTANITDGGSATFNYTVGVTHDAGTDSGWTVTGKIDVTNPNLYAVSGVSVSDAIDSNATCTVTGGSSSIAAGATATFNYTCTYSAAPAANSQTNTATVTWTPIGSPNDSTTATAGVDWTTVTPSVSGGTITVVDDKTDPANPVELGTAAYTQANPIEFIYSKTFNGVGGECTDYTNTAKIVETEKTAKAKVTVCVGKDLTVAKTAAGTFDRTYLWNITKDVDKTSVKIALGGTATFNYTVVAQQTGVSDTGWELHGVITLSNPNNWEAITLTSLADAVDNGGVCTVAPGPYIVPARVGAVNGTLSVSYTCTYAGMPSSYSGTNTATATWSAATYFTPSGWAAGSQAFALAQDGSTNKTVTVTDTFAGDLGTVTATDVVPWASKEFKYSKDFTGVGGTCTKYDNTATITETKQSDSESVEVCVGKDLTVAKTAAGTFDRAYLWSIAKDADKTAVKIADGGSYTFKYTVVAQQTGVSDSGWTLAGKITITNPNDWQAITLTGLADVVDNGGLCTVAPGPYVVPKSGSIEVAYSCTYAAAPSSYTGKNTATATWDKAAYFTPSGSAAGEKAFTLTQLGSTNKTIHVTDTFAGDLGTVTATDSAPWAKGTFTYDRTISGVGGTCTKYDNTATITETKQSDSESVEVCVGKDLTVAKTAAGTFDRAYLWSIAKDADKTAVKIADGGSYTFKYTVVAQQTGVSDSGWTLAGKITITNPNDWQAITLTGLADVVDNGGLCTVAPGPYVVPKSGSIEVAYSCTYAAAPSSYTGKNTATATWDKAAYFTPSGSAAGEKAFTLTQLGSTNKTIHVTDTFAGDLGTVTATDSAPWAKGTFTYDRTISGVGGTCTKYDNTATITETKQSDSESVEVCVGKDLTVAKTAAGTFDRAYLWSIAKDADKTAVKIADGGSYTFKYTVVAQQTGVSDSGWTLAGKITITNPNDWQAITLTGLADVVDNGGLCTVAPGPYVVPKGGSIEVAYSCTYAAAPSSYTGKNTATATWDKAAYFTPSGSAAGEKAFTLTQLGSTNKTIHVTDTFAGDLGTVTATDSAPWAKGTFTYDRTISGVGGTCTKYDNTATITETKQSDSESVEVCVGKDLTVAKTAAGTFDREYLWKIDKSANQTSFSGIVGSKVTVNYTVKVDQTGVKTFNATLSGVITVSNPNDWEDITLTGLTDKVDNGGVCTLASGTYVVPAGKSIDVAYSCTYTNPPASLSGINTAIATWDKVKYFTPNGSAQVQKPFTLALANTLNKTIHVTDTYAGPLGTVTGTDQAPWATKTWTYSREFTAAFSCVAYDNTATITETGQNDSVTVTVCGDYWAFTPGFWKNHTSSDPSGHDAWQWTAYKTSHLLSTVFEPAYLTDKPKGSNKMLGQYTLLQSLSFKGGAGIVGAKQTLLRARRGRAAQRILPRVLGASHRPVGLLPLHLGRHHQHGERGPGVQRPANHAGPGL